MKSVKAQTRKEIGTNMLGRLKCYYLKHIETLASLAWKGNCSMGYLIKILYNYKCSR